MNITTETHTETQLRCMLVKLVRASQKTDGDIARNNMAQISSEMVLLSKYRLSELSC